MERVGLKDPTLYYAMSIKSKCCKARVVVRGKTTMYYICLKCGEPCDTFLVERKTWQINPRTRVVPNKRKKLNKYTRADARKEGY